MKLAPLLYRALETMSSSPGADSHFSGATPSLREGVGLISWPPWPWLSGWPPPFLLLQNQSSVPVTRSLYNARKVPSLRLDGCYSGYIVKSFLKFTSTYPTSIYSSPALCCDGAIKGGRVTAFNNTKKPCPQGACILPGETNHEGDTGANCIVC